MSSHGIVQVPPGVQCFVGEEARRRRRIENRVLTVFEGWDYEEIIPPLFDYAEVFAPSALARKTYTFVGRDGSLLALRPDFTSLLAKIAAGRLAHRAAPIRLYYSGEVLRYEPPKAGRQSELHQMGLEHLGGAGPAADAEVLAVAAECLEATGVQDFVFALGHVGAFWGLVRPLGLEEQALDELRARVENKDAEGVRDLLSRLHVEPTTLEALVRLATLAGGVARLGEASRALAFSPEASAAVAELGEVARALAEAGLGARIDIDLGEVRGLDYYTGLVFRIYAPGLGFEVGGGGRYDGLLARFGRPMPAVGFMIGLDRLALLLERQGTLPDAEAPPAEPVCEPTVGGSLALARAMRAEGRRVRLGSGGAE
jgi:ATP phosphoribosyltransferase regulatory subunit